MSCTCALTQKSFGLYGKCNFCLEKEIHNLKFDLSIMTEKRDELKEERDRYKRVLDEIKAVRGLE